MVVEGKSATGACRSIVVGEEVRRYTVYYDLTRDSPIRRHSASSCAISAVIISKQRYVSCYVRPCNSGHLLIHMHSASVTAWPEVRACIEPAARLHYVH